MLGRAWRLGAVGWGSARPPSRRPHPPHPPPSPAGNYNLDGPIYIDLKKRTSKAGEPPVWQILDAYYGTFLIYDTPPEGRRLDIIV